MVVKVSFLSEKSAHDGRFLVYFSLVDVPNFGGLSGSEDRGGGDNSIQFMNFGRVGDKSFKEWRQNMGGGGVEGWVTTIF